MSENRFLEFGGSPDGFLFNAKKALNGAIGDKIVNGIVSSKLNSKSEQGKDEAADPIPKIGGKGDGGTHKAIRLSARPYGMGRGLHHQSTPRAEKISRA